MNLMLEKYPDSSSVFLPSLLASRKFQGPRSEDSCPYREKASLLLTALRGGLAGLQGPCSGGDGGRGLQASRLSLASLHAGFLGRGPCPLRPVKSVALTWVLVKLATHVAHPSRLLSSTPAVSLSLLPSGSSRVLPLLRGGSKTFPASWNSDCRAPWKLPLFAC